MNKTLKTFSVMSVLCVVGCTLPILVPLLLGTGATLGIFSFIENGLEKYILIFLALTTVIAGVILFKKNRQAGCHGTNKCGCGSKKISNSNDACIPKSSLK